MSLVCTCDLVASHVYTGGGRGEVPHLRTRFGLPVVGRRREGTTERVTIRRVVGGIREEVRNETRRMPSVEYDLRGHLSHCPMYQPPRIPVSKKRQRRQRLDIYLEQSLAWRGRRRPNPKTPRPNIAPGVPQAARKLLHGDRRYYYHQFDTLLSRAAWYKPVKPKPVKRRERRGQAKPR